MPNPFWLSLAWGRACAASDGRAEAVHSCSLTLTLAQPCHNLAVVPSFHFVPLAVCSLVFIGGHLITCHRNGSQSTCHSPTSAHKHTRKQKSTHAHTQAYKLNTRKNTHASTHTYTHTLNTQHTHTHTHTHLTSLDRQPPPKQSNWSVTVGCDTLQSAWPKHGRPHTLCTDCKVARTFSPPSAISCSPHS